MVRTYLIKFNIVEKLLWKLKSKYINIHLLKVINLLLLEIFIKKDNKANISSHFIISFIKLIKSDLIRTRNYKMNLVNKTHTSVQLVNVCKVKHNFLIRTTYDMAPYDDWIKLYKLGILKLKETGFA